MAIGLAKRLKKAALLGAGGGNITVGGSTTAVIDGATPTDVSLTSLSLSEGNVLILMGAADDDLYGVYREVWIDHSTSPGWIACSDDSSSGADGHAWLLRCGSTPPSAVRVRGTSSTLKTPVAIQKFSNVDDRLFDVLASSSVIGAGTTADPPAVTTVTDNALVVALASLDNDDATVSAFPSGYSNGVEKNTGQSSTTVGATVAMASKEVESPGSENPGTFTFSSSDGTESFTLALMPNQNVVSGWPIQVVGGWDGFVDGVIYQGSGNQNFSLPSGLQENDVVVVLTACKANHVGTSGSPMVSSGWSAAYNDFASIDCHAFYKKMGATPDTTVTLDDSTSANFDAIVVIFALRGVDTTTQLDATPTTLASNVNAPSVTTVTNDAMLALVKCCADHAYSVWNWPIGAAWHHCFSHDIGSTEPVSINVCFLSQAVAGASGTKSMNVTVESYARFSANIPFRPA